MSDMNTILAAPVSYTHLSLNEDGTAKIKTDLPFGSYYVQELATDSHYKLSDTKYPVTFPCLQTFWLRNLPSPCGAGLPFLFCLPCPGSYTHLDVYKRQEFSVPLCDKAGVRLRIVVVKINAGFNNCQLVCDFER